MQATADRAIAGLAQRQHGNVTRTQLLAVGLTDNGIARRVRAGRLFRVHRGVYAVGRPPVVVLERAAAAVLACGPHAALGHLAALGLWEIGRWPRRFAVVLIASDRRPAGITVHRPAHLHRRDLTTERGIRVTTPARTLLDCALQLTDAQLIRAVNEARHARLTSPDGLHDVITRYPNHPGARRLAPFAERDAPLTRSPFEDRFRALCRCHGLPMPQFNARVCGFTVDAVFVAERLIVELDSWEFHRDRVAFVVDRERDATTLQGGYATVRITWERPDHVEAARLHDILRQRRSAA